MWHRSERIAGALLLLVASLPARAGVEPCNTAQKRTEMTALLRRAAEDRARHAESLLRAALERAEQAEAFQPRVVRDAPNLVLAEAGTGTGKTLGYLAPASLWAEENAGAVWVSTCPFSGIEAIARSKAESRSVEIRIRRPTGRS